MYSSAGRDNIAILALRARTSKMYTQTLQHLGTDNHLILWNLRPHGLTGSKLEKVCDKVGITLNKNCVPEDTSAISPGGVRVGTPALTTRGFKEEHFTKVAELLHEALEIAVDVQSKSGKKLRDFLPALDQCDKLAGLRKKVVALATSFPMPGVGFETVVGKN